MAKTPTPEEAIERARRTQDARIDAVRVLAEVRQNVDDVRTDTERERAELEARIAQRVRDAERDDVRAYNAALAVGWSADELRKIGFAEPEKKARARRRARKRADKSSAVDGSQSAPNTALPSSDPQLIGA